LDGILWSCHCRLGIWMFIIYMYSSTNGVFYILIRNNPIWLSQWKMLNIGPRICLLYKSLIKCIARYVDKQQLSLCPWMLRIKTVQILCQNGMYIFIYTYIFKGEFEDTKGVIRIYKSKDRQHNGQKKEDKTLHIKLKIE
jgi:hypothetical protein